MTGVTTHIPEPELELGRRTAKTWSLRADAGIWQRIALIGAAKDTEKCQAWRKVANDS